jgi:hypothetical protein
MLLKNCLFIYTRCFRSKTLLSRSIISSYFTKILQAKLDKTRLIQIPAALEGLHEIRGISVHEMVEILDEDVLDELEVVHR